MAHASHYLFLSPLLHPFPIHDRTMTQAPYFLILDDDVVFSHTLARGLSRRGFIPHMAHTLQEAIELSIKYPFSAITIDLKLTESSGLQIIQPLRQQHPDAKILILTGYSSIATAVQAIKLGADNYLAKPASIESILKSISINEIDDGDLDTMSDEIPSVNRLEWEHIQRVLSEHHGNISSTARALNMHRRTLQRKLLKKPVTK